MLEEIEYKRKNVYEDKVKTYDEKRMLPMMCKYEVMAKISKQKIFKQMKINGGICRQFKSISVSEKGEIESNTEKFK